MALLEIACFNCESALIASNSGADRIELCAGPEFGGTTPNFNSLVNIKDQIAVPVFVMIRPRGGDFIYTDTEFQEMRANIEQFKEVASGFAFGVLDANSRIDIRRTRELVRLAYPLPCTFHRAFDQTIDPFKALEDIVSCGITTILTSGGASSAIDGRDTLFKLVKRAQERIAIMPGGGVRSTNIEELRESTQASLFHSSALVDNGCIASVTEIRRLKVACNRDVIHQGDA
jgi:copper homeostasis protein